MHLPHLKEHPTDAHLALQSPVELFRHKAQAGIISGNLFAEMGKSMKTGGPFAIWQVRGAGGPHQAHTRRRAAPTTPAAAPATSHIA